MRNLLTEGLRCAIPERHRDLFTSSSSVPSVPASKLILRVSTDGTPQVELGTLMFMRGTLIHWCPPKSLELYAVPVIVGNGRRKGVPR